MSAPRTLVIISPAPHYEWDGQLWSHEPYVREINLWAGLFDRVILVGPGEVTRPAGDCVVFDCANVELAAVPPTGGDGVAPKVRQLVLLPVLVWRICRALSHADGVHVRCPGNIGLLGVLLAPIFSRRLVAKYAGQWTGFPGEKWTVRLQRALLRSRWWRGPVTVYGEWPNQPPHITPFFTSVLTDAQVERTGNTSDRRRVEGTLRVLFVGRLSGPKNVDTLLRATAIARRNGVDVHCTIVGDGAERLNLEELACAEGIDSIVSFAGAVGLDDVLEHYERADTLVLVSESEGWPKAIAEAMAFGLVCIGSDRGMVPQMLGDGRGVVVPPGDDEALAQEMCRIAANPTASDQMGRQAAEWGQRHSLEGLQAAIADLLAEKWATSIGQAENRIAVLHVTDTLDAGGAERMAVNLVNRVSRTRFRPFLCTTRHNGVLVSHVRADVPLLALGRTRRIKDVLAIARLAHFLRTESIDVIHAHGTSVFIAVAARMLAPEVRVIWHDHLGTSTSSRQRKRRLYRLAASRVDHVITVRRDLEEWAHRELKLPTGQVTTLPNFVLREEDPMLTSAIPGPPGKRIVCVANLRRQKDHLMLLEAMVRVLEHVPVHLLLVGGTVDRIVESEIKERISALGLHPNVSLLGTRSDVSAVLDQCTIGVLSSRSEGFPLALLEYGLAGLPVVATAVGGCSEILDHGLAGRLVEAGDHGALANALVDLLLDPITARQLGQRLKERVEDHYSADAVVAQVEYLYVEVLMLGGRRTSPVAP